jgi:hypothetical protein
MLKMEEKPAKSSKDKKIRKDKSPDKKWKTC